FAPRSAFHRTFTKPWKSSRRKRKFCSPGSCAKPRSDTSTTNGRCSGPRTRSSNEREACALEARLFTRDEARAKYRGRETLHAGPVLRRGRHHGRFPRSRISLPLRERLHEGSR